MNNSPIDTINKETHDYLSSFFEYSPENLRRIDKGFINYAGFVKKNALTALEIPFDETREMALENVEEHFQEVAFLLNEFKRLNFQVIPVEDLSLIEKMLETEFENIDKRDRSRYFEKMEEEMLKMLRITSLPSSKNMGINDEKLRELTTPFSKRLQKIEPKALEDMLDYYKDFFEYVVNRTLREIYKKYTKIYEKGSNNKLDFIIKESPNHNKIGNFKLIEFFIEAWNDSPIPKQLKYFKPVIRNAIAHDIGNDVDINYTKNTISFSSGEYDLEVTISEFITEYWGSVVSVYKTIANFIPRYRTLLEIEKKFVFTLLNENNEELRFSADGPLDFVYASPELKLFVITYNGFLRAKKDQNLYTKLIGSISDFLLEETTAKKNTQIIPYLIRFLLSDYPFEKPEPFKREVCEIYLKNVKLGYFQDDKKLFQDFLTE